MSAHKMEQLKKKNHNHVKRNIRKLFNKLKKDNDSTADCTPDHTRSSIDSTPRNLTIVVQNDSFTPQRKRKSPATITNEPKKSRRGSESLIIINDDDLTTNNDSCILVSPPRNSNNNINCSTPIAQRDSKTIQNLIINNFPKSNNNDNSTQNSNKDGNQTKNINRDSYLTIDLTGDSENKSITVIDVEKTTMDDTQDCTVVSVSNPSLSMSGDSEVTVLRNNKNSKDKQIKKFANGIAQLNSSEKGKLLEYIAQKIFSGCNIKDNFQNTFANIRVSWFI